MTGLERNTRNVIAFYEMMFNDGKVVEHWDVLQSLPETSANANGMF